MDNKDEASSDHETSSGSGFNEEEQNARLSSSSEAINQDSTTEQREETEEATHETDKEEEKKKETSSSVSDEEAKDKETYLSSRTHQDSIKEEEEAEKAEEKTSSSDVESSEKKVTNISASHEEAKDKETSVLPSEAEEKEQDSIFSDILAGIEANPNILQTKYHNNDIRFALFEDSAPLGSNPALLRYLHEKSELIDINARVLEKLKRRRQEAIKLGVNLSLLVAEALFFSPDIILKMTPETFQGFLKTDNGPSIVNGVVVFYLTEVYNRLRKLARLPIPILRADDEFIDPSYFTKFFRLFSDAMVILERVISGIRDLSDTVVLEEEPEKLCALDSAIEDCGKQLRKIGVAIQEAKQLCSKGLGSDDDKTNEVLGTNLEDDFFRLWNNLFPAAWDPDTDSDLTDADDND